MGTPKDKISLGFTKITEKLNQLFGLIPTKTSHIENDGDGTSPFVTANDVAGGSQNNIAKTIPVLDTDLATLDPAGLATYFNSLADGIMKQGFESWLINIVDASDNIIKTFELVNRGKGPVGLEAVSANVANTLTAAMFQEINLPIVPDYDDIADLTTHQAEQKLGAEYYVTDASDDENINFPAGEDKLQATYRYKGVANGAIGDYVLVAVPYGIAAVNLSQFNDDIGAKDLKVIKVTEKSQIVNQVLDSTVKYEIRVNLSLLASEWIYADNMPLIEGMGADFTTIETTEPNSVIFKGQNCKNINLKNIALSPKGTGSKAFDVKDVDAVFGTSEGTHEFRLVGVNFLDAESFGEVNGFRQLFAKDIGHYGCKNGWTMSGVWNGGFYQESNVFVFDSGGTLFKQGTNLSFKDRFIIQMNFSFPTGAVFMDFSPAVFVDNEALQIVDCVAKVDGIKNDDNVLTLFPNISPNNPKCLWGINTGLPSTAAEKIVIDEAVNGTYTIDWLNDTYDLTLTGDTVFSEINLPASGRRTKTLNITISGNFVPTFPAGWETNRVGSFKGTDLNSIDIKFISGGKYAMKISNSLTVYPAPIIGTITPVSLLPDQTQELVISGSFFTPNGFVLLEGQTINSQEFDPDTGNYILSVTTGATEGEFDVTVNNGTATTKVDGLIVNLGEVFIPTESDWESVVEPINLTESGNVKTKIYDSFGEAVWSQEIDYTEDFAIRFNFYPSSLGEMDASFRVQLGIVKASNGVEMYGYGTYRNNTTNMKIAEWVDGVIISSTTYTGVNQAESFGKVKNVLIEFSKVGSNLYWKLDGVIKAIYGNNLTENLKIKVKVKQIDIRNIKYIKLP